MRRHDVSQWGHGLLNSLYITLPSRQYHTCNTNCFWLIYRGRYFQDILGAEHGSPYINIMTMCVESSALVVIFNGTYTALTFAQQRRPDAYWALIPFQLLPHIFVGGFFLRTVIFYRRLLYLTIRILTLVCSAKCHRHEFGIDSESLFLAWVFATVLRPPLGDYRRLYVPCSKNLAVLFSTPGSLLDGSWLLRRYSVVRIENCTIEPKHVHLDLPLATKNWNLFFRIHLSAQSWIVLF